MTTHRQSGITLIEVLVTIVVISIALLGSLRMQVLSIRANTDASLRNQATVMANDFIERVRINRTAARAGTYATIDYGAIDCTAAPTTPCWDRSSGNAQQCTSAEMATSDAWRWVCSVQAAVPGATPAMAWDGTSYALTLTWTSLDLDGSAQTQRVAVSLVP